MRLQLVCQLLVLAFWIFGFYRNLNSDYRNNEPAAGVAISFVVMVALLLIFVGSGALSLIRPLIIDPLIR